MKQLFNLKILLIGGAVFVLLIAGYFFSSQKDNNTAPEATNTVTDENQTETTKTPESDESKTSIQKLLNWSKTTSFKCKYTDSMGDEVTSYIKKGSIRTDSYDPIGKEEGSAIVKDGLVYVWEKERGEGFKMAFDPNDNKQSGDPNSYTSFSGTDFVKQLENFQTSCVPTAVDDALFELPPGVSFVDYSELFNKVNNQKAQ